MRIIECNSLTKAYGSIKALNNLNVSFEDKKITGLVGKNGAGKTTFLKLVAGFLKKTSGEVRVMSENPFNNLKISSNMIFIDENMNYPNNMRIIEILDIAKMFYENWDEKLARGLFEYFGLNPNQNYQNLSKGSTSTFNMIIGLSAHAGITIFDEPTSGMDASVRKDFYRAVLKDYIECPRTIIISSHHLTEIEEIVEDVLLINEGKEVLHLPMIDLKELVIGMRGTKEKIMKLVSNNKILHTESIGEETFAVIRDGDAELTREKVRQEGIELVKIPADDICVYLTKKNKGGIDSVFERQ